MRKIAYGLLGFFLVLIPQSQTSAADAEKPTPIKLEVQPNRWRFEVNGVPYEVEGVEPPTEPFFIHLYGWQPTGSWRGRNFTAY
jgi:hypothetical protein